MNEKENKFKMNKNKRNKMMKTIEKEEERCRRWKNSKELQLKVYVKVLLIRKCQ